MHFLFECHIDKYASLISTPVPVISLDTVLSNPLKPGVESRMPEDAVGAAPTGDAPTISEWSTSVLSTKVRIILEVWRYVVTRLYIQSSRSLNIAGTCTLFYSSQIACRASFVYDDVMTWKCYPHCWPFARGIHRSPMDSPHKGPVMRISVSFVASLNILQTIELSVIWDSLTYCGLVAPYGDIDLGQHWRM